MALKVTDLTSENVGLLPLPCRGCTFWELASPRETRYLGHTSDAKSDWVHQAEVTTGPPGKLLYDDGRVIGYALTSAPAQFRRSRVFFHQPSAQALFIATMWITPLERGNGAGRHLLRAVVADAHRGGYRYVEGYGFRGAGPDGNCVLAESFLAQMGFQVWRDHLHWPLMRLELRQTVTETMEAALERVRVAFRPRRVHTPARPYIDRP